jgi:hypothetical protein
MVTLMARQVRKNCTMKPWRTKIRLFILLVVAIYTTSISYAHIVHVETFNFYPGIDIFEFKHENHPYRITRRICKVCEGWIFRHHQNWKGSHSGDSSLNLICVGVQSEPESQQTPNATLTSYLRAPRQLIY